VPEHLDASLAQPKVAVVDPLTVLLDALALPSTTLDSGARATPEPSSAELRALVVSKFDRDNLMRRLADFAADAERYRGPTAGVLREVGADRDQELVDRASDLLKRAEQSRPGITDGLVGQIDAQGGRVLVVGGSVAAPIVMGDVAVYASVSIDPRARQNRRDMLKQVRDTWIAGYLEPSLRGAALPAPDLEVRARTTVDRQPAEDWATVVSQSGRPARTDAPVASIGQLFDDRPPRIAHSFGRARRRQRPHCCSG